MFLYGQWRLKINLIKADDHKEIGNAEIRTISEYNFISP